MMFEWKDFVDVACHLNAAGGSILPEEAAYRSAVNRAYYGAYGHCTKYAMDNFGFIPEGSGADHRSLRMCFKNKSKGNPAMIRIVSKLYELHEWRKDCDYHSVTLDSKAPGNMAIEAIKDAQEIINELPDTTGRLFL